MADAKREGKWGEREGSACYKSLCFCIPPTKSLTYPITSTVNTWPITIKGALLSMHGPNLRTLFTRSRNYQVEMLFSNDIIIVQNTVEHFYCSCSANTTSSDQFGVNTEEPFGLVSKNSLVQSTEQSPFWNANNFWKENYVHLSKSSMDNVYWSLSSFFTTISKIIQGGVWFAEKSHVQLLNLCSCLWISALQMTRITSVCCSVFGQIQYTKPPEHPLCVKQARYSPNLNFCFQYMDLC